MERQMDKWNDARLDELSQATKAGFAKVDNRFEKLDQRLEGVEAEMKGGFAQVAIEIKEETRHLDKKFDRLQNTLLAGAIVLLAALVGLIATQV